MQMIKSIINSLRKIFSFTIYERKELDIGKRFQIFPSKITLLQLIFIIVVSTYVIVFGIGLLWVPKYEISTKHFKIYSSTSIENTKNVGEAVELVYDNYFLFFKDILSETKSDTLLKLKLYDTRNEFKTFNMGSGWAEAYFLGDTCYAYYPQNEVHPSQWMEHEVVHQLNEVIAKFKLEKWLDEGIADYFGTSVIREGKLNLGEVDINTYPVWLLKSLEISGNLKEDIDKKRIIPLRSIITGNGGPSMNTSFNLYYIHWWSLTHYLIHRENGKHKDAFLNLVRDGGNLESFEKNIEKVELIESEWYEYLKELKKLIR